ncbi:hypothetical protein AMATHDRAFT_197681 [Amanita thiersii Skay4041]|uniref:Protein kinase domain-containing protein n=1 Tax=Amanita thiersii Skay4041 TaxID=703135 RepID=A0A2A9NAP7_9AGAR|nr:hypothetical protein AMATHDRAFT_197681 [Amanita thiersii Skay4041]
MPDARQALSSDDSLRDIFSGVPDQHCVHILIEVPGRAQLRNLSFNGEIDQCLQYLADNLEAPADMAKFENLFPMYKDILKKNRIVCHRPSTVLVPPISLLHEVFTNFEVDMQNLKPTKEDLIFADELGFAMSKFYPFEKPRVQKFHEVFQEFGGMNLATTTIDNSRIESDGGHQYYALKLILTEAKNELGKTNDAFIQLMIYYVRHVIFARQKTEKLRQTSLPCILLFYNGPFLGVAGALLTTSVHCEVIAVLSLLWNDSEPLNNTRFMLARTLGSIKKAVNELKDRHPDGEPKPSELRSNDCPYITRYRCDGEEHQFTYDELQPESFASHLIFAAKTGERRISVKFVREYSDETHKFWEERKRAPKLIAIDRTSLLGWLIVITEYPQGFEYWTKPPPEDVLNDLKALIKEFEAHGFVPGDICADNLLIGKERGSNKLVFNLMDFDWSGKVGSKHHISCGEKSFIRAKKAGPYRPMTFTYHKAKREEDWKNGKMPTKLDSGDEAKNFGLSDLNEEVQSAEPSEFGEETEYPEPSEWEEEANNSDGGSSSD